MTKASPHRSRITNHDILLFPFSALGIHMRAEIRSDQKKGKFKNAVIPMAAIIEGKKYELIRRNKSRYRRGDGLRRVDRGRDGPRVAKGFLVTPPCSRMERTERAGKPRHGWANPRGRESGSERVNGMRDIEGKVAREAMSERSRGDASDIEGQTERSKMGAST